MSDQRNHDLSVVVLARDEEKGIARCLRSVRFAGEVVVIDDGSTDRTCSISRKMGAKVVVHRHSGDNWDLNRNVGLRIAKNEWVLFVDVDEEPSAELVDEIREVISSRSDMGGYWIPLRQIWFGFEFRHALGDSKKLALVRRLRARFQGEHLHEVPFVEGAVGRLRSPMIHRTYADIREYVLRTNRYTDNEALHLVRSGTRVGVGRLVIRPLRYFVYRFVKRRGYRDGVPGLIVCVLSTFYAFLEAAKAWELWRRRAS